MKINSEKLFDYINKLANNEQVKFKVFYYDDYITEVYWDGKDFNWESGTFTSGAFFDKNFDFYVIEEDKEIEKIDTMLFLKEPYPVEVTILFTKIQELIDEVNKLKENK